MPEGIAHGRKASPREGLYLAIQFRARANGAHRGRADWMAVARPAAYAQLGMVVLARNWRCRQGELDLVLAKGGLVVFCEVKTRASAAFGSPLEAVTAARTGSVVAAPQR